MAAYAAGELARAIDCLGWRAGRLHEGVHQARKSLRRLRAVLALGGAALGPGATTVDADVRRINRQLSALRDAHALVEVIDRLMAVSGDEPTRRLLQRARRGAAANRVRQARAAMDEDPGLAARRTRLVPLRTTVMGLRWEALDEQRLAGALERSRERVRKASARAADGRGDDEDWHRWRRRARRLSQQRRALDASGVAASKASHDEKRLAEWLGLAQDYTLLGEHCRTPGLFNDDDRRALRVMAEAGAKRLREQIIAAMR